MDRAEWHQALSCQLDPQLGWNWFALAELLLERKRETEAWACFRRASAALPEEHWIADHAAELQLKRLLGGETLEQGGSASSYRLWCAELEPRLPLSSQRLVHQWWLEPMPALPQQGWIVLMHKAAQLRAGGLQAIEQWLKQCPADSQPDLIYCDEDRLVDGERADPWFKPGWCWESYWAMPWLESFSAWRVSWLRLHQLALPPLDLGEQQQWIWRALEQRPRAAGVPRVLVHRLDGASGVPTEQVKALQAHLRRMGEGDVKVSRSNQVIGAMHLQWPIPNPLRCRIVIPTRNQAKLLAACLQSLKTTLSGDAVSWEIVVIDNGSTEPELAALLKQWNEQLAGRFAVMRDTRAFNWSRLNHLGVQHTWAAQPAPELLLFLNNDVEALEAGWLEAMASHACRESIGCVGANLLYPDGGLQHGGVVVGMHGGADHAYRGLPLRHSVHRGRSQLLSNWGAVTGACLMVRRSLYEQAGGFDPALPVEFNDVDFCLRLGQAGYRHVIPPDAVLIHKESQSRPCHNSPTEQSALRLMQSRWGKRLTTCSPWWPESSDPSAADGRAKEWRSAQ
ncbi:glycosyltransferase [Synechococcus sp. HK05]|uniref:glycosyltransferase family 2 protein n=1 Tax=Synechococcus sp. HK05 TaxID=2725975 RepID=UPI001C37EE98|nr:glycosyltransferase [Synechococcus sp. HK05]MBV2350362.1 glycosyltransferase [Synechococcus sp. HK05]